ncbi:MAG: energy transducer TonB [Bacteroidetes bacterium]|nr:energy transducer TonB [Bacteroidota bacterium]
MKTVQVKRYSKSYGAFEMKEFISKSTLKSFTITMVMIIVIPLVFIALQGSVTPSLDVIHIPQITTVLLQNPTVKQPISTVQPPLVQNATTPFSNSTNSKSGSQIIAVTEPTKNIEISNNSIQNLNSNSNSSVIINNNNNSTVVESAKSFVIVENSGSEEVFFDVDSYPELNYSQLQQNLVYPELALRNGIEGKVLLRVVVGKNGKPVLGKVKVMDSSNDLFNQSAIEAINKSIFTPATVNKQPIEVPIIVPIVFRLH